MTACTGTARLPVATTPDYLRHAIVLAAWVAALKAFSLLYRLRS